MLVELRPVVTEVKPWQGRTAEDMIGKSLVVRPVVGRDFKYQVSLPKDRLAELSNRLGVNLDLNANPDTPHEFWDEHSLARVKLEYKTRIFDTDNPQDEIQLGILKGHPKIANSISEAAAHPGVEFVIYSAEEEAAKSASKVERIQRCYELFGKMGEADKRAIIRIINGKNLDSVNAVNGEIGNIINSQPDTFLEWAEADRDLLNIRSLVLEAEGAGWIVRDGAQLKYGDVFLGLDYDETVKTLMRTENQAIVARLKEKLSR